MSIVSVVIPAHDDERYVAEAIESVLGQTHREVEVIVVDDGSTDATASIARGFGEPVRCVVQANAGPSVARNRGLELARGEYVAFLDADDRFQPERVALLVEALEGASKRAVFATTDAVLWDGERGVRPFRVSTPQAGERDLTTFLDETWCYIGILARRDTLMRVGGFRHELWRCEDYDLWLRLLCGGNTYAYVPGSLYLYRTQTQSLSTDYSRRLRAAYEVGWHALRTLPLTRGQRRRLAYLLWEDRACLRAEAAGTARAAGRWGEWLGHSGARAACQAARVILRPRYSLERVWRHHPVAGMAGQV